MPTYLYRNLMTGETFEYEQRITDDALTVHPETGQPVKRLIQPVGIAFKGSGFYVNDARKGAAGKHGAHGATAAPADAGGGHDAGGAGKEPGGAATTAAAPPTGG